MSDSKVTELTELTSVAVSDITYIVDDPTGTPVSKKCTAQNFVKGGILSGALAGLADTTLTASKALQSSSAGVIQASAVTSTELSCLSGVTSAVQSQLDGKTNWKGEAAIEPSSASSGDMYYNTDTSTVYIYAESAWIALN